MSREFKLNNKAVSESDFNALAGFLRQMGEQGAVAKALEDNHITEAEFVGLLDADHDGEIRPEDFYQNPNLNLATDLRGLSELIEQNQFVRRGILDDRYFSFARLGVNAKFMSQNLPEWPKNGANLMTAYSRYPFLQAKFVLLNFHLMTFLSDREQERVWPLVISDLKRRGVSYDADKIGTFGDFKKYLSENGIRFPERVLSIETALTLIANRKSLASPDSRPTALLLYNTSDHNGAFGDHGTVPVLDTFVKSGKFRVLYYEAGSEGEFAEIRKNIVKTTGKRIHTLILAGHGNADSLALGGDDPANVDWLKKERAYIDIGDFNAGEMDELGSQMEAAGQVLLFACSNGSGHAEQDNLANRFIQTLPGRRILSSRKSTNLDSLRINGDLSLGVEWIEEGSAYQPDEKSKPKRLWGPEYATGLTLGARTMLAVPLASGTDTKAGLALQITGGWRKEGAYTGVVISKTLNKSRYAAAIERAYYLVSDFYSGENRRWNVSGQLQAGAFYGEDGTGLTLGVLGVFHYRPVKALGLGMAAGVSGDVAVLGGLKVGANQQYGLSADYRF